MEDNKGSFLSKLLRRKQEAPVEQQELDESQIAPVGQFLPQTFLSLTPEQEQEMPQEEKERLQMMLNKMPPVKIGDLNLALYDAGYLSDGGYYAKVLFRNGTDLSEDLNMQQLELSLLDASWQRVARGTFRLQNFGVLRFGESRPWIFAFRKENHLVHDADFSEFELVVE